MKQSVSPASVQPASHNLPSVPICMSLGGRVVVCVAWLRLQACLANTCTNFYVDYQPEFQDWHNHAYMHCVNQSRLQETDTQKSTRKETTNSTGELGLQVTDISQYGDIAAAQSVLVPAGAKVLDKSTSKVQQPPRNTGTLAGVFQAPPTTIYRY